MSLSVGARLGPYEITGSLGAGGMGEVYRARDTELGREVAIKVLPTAFLQDPERLARFQREAQVLASLNHPSIAAIHGLERSAGVPALVMELVEGETLADRILRGPLPLDEMVQIARQIADALEVAHDRGVVHRDLKPANVKVRPDGTVKVLDFGLAKAIEPEGAGRVSGRVSSTMSPTVVSPAMTQAGFILGTAAYMAPEQAKGREVDQRADIWAFGCVLYEMLTGRRAFPGEDVTDTLAAVVLRDPDWTTLPSGTAAGVRRLLTRCLQKDPRQRLHHIADARLDLDEPATPVASTRAPTLRVWSRRSVLVIAMAALVIVAAAAVQIWRLMGASRSSPGLVRFAIPPPAGLEFGEPNEDLAVVSPDGSRIVLAYGRGARTQLYTRRLDEAEAKPIAGTEGGSRPFFSPDGKWVAFTAGSTMKKVPVDVGGAVSIVQSQMGTGAWMPDDTIVFTPNYTAGLWRVSASGGTPQKLTEPRTADGELGHFWPQILPDGRSVLFTSFRTPAERSRIEVYSLDTGTRTVVVDGGFFGRYVSTGHLLFAKTTTLFALPFDARRYSTRGQPAPVLSGVATSLPNGHAQFSVSETGTLTYLANAGLNAPRRLAWVDRAGRATFVSEERRRFEDPSLSPDGRSLALTIRDENDADIWVYDLTRGTFRRITSSPATQFQPTWTPDSRRLFFVFEEPTFHIYSRAVDSTEEPRRVLDGPFDLIPWSVSPDGKYLVYQRNDPALVSGIWLLPLTGDASPRVLIDTAAPESGGLVSPDGKWLAYRSEETGRSEIYIQSFPDGTERIPVSTNGGEQPMWSVDGTELFFRDVDKTMVASVHGRTVGRPTMLFEMRVLALDVARDGRFLAVVPDPTVPPASVNVVLNWTEELKRLVPSD